MMQANSVVNCGQIALPEPEPDYGGETTPNQDSSCRLWLTTTTLSHRYRIVTILLLLYSPSSIINCLKQASDIFCALLQRGACQIHHPFRPSVTASPHPHKRTKPPHPLKGQTAVIGESSETHRYLMYLDTLASWSRHHACRQFQIRRRCMLVWPGHSSAKTLATCSGVRWLLTQTEADCRDDAGLPACVKIE